MKGTYKPFKFQVILQCSTNIIIKPNILSHIQRHTIPYIKIKIN